MPYYQPGPPGPPTVRQIPVLEDYLVADFTQEDYMSMLLHDAGPLKRFLREQNNQRRLNLNKLVIIGNDMGATLAAAWGNRDWTPMPGSPPPARDTKVVVLISPRDEPPIQQALESRAFQGNVDFLSLVGRLNGEKYEEAQSLRTRFFGRNPETTDLGLESRFPVLGYQTERQGGDLLGIAEWRAAETIADFIEQRLGERRPAEIRWRMLPM